MFYLIGCAVCYFRATAAFYHFDEELFLIRPTRKITVFVFSIGSWLSFCSFIMIYFIEERGKAFFKTNNKELLVRWNNRNNC